MTSAYQHVVHDLAEEHAALERVLVQMTPEQWDLPTHAPGWLVRHQVAHLTVFDGAAALAMNNVTSFRQARISEPDYLQEASAKRPPQLLAEWRRNSQALCERAAALDESGRLPWYGPDMSPTSFVTARLMECWSHGLDAVDVVGIERPDSDRLRHVAFIGFRARPFSFTNRGLPAPAEPVCVELIAPSGETWTFGDPAATNRVSGTATDFCRVVTRRRHRADTVLTIQGAAATAWMEVAQAFAGPPGAGRQAGEFAVEAIS